MKQMARATTARMGLDKSRNEKPNYARQQMSGTTMEVASRTMGFSNGSCRRRRRVRWMIWL
jgi:hypothetical protein